MVDVTTEIIIGRELKEVAVFAINPDNAPYWYANIKSAVWKTPKPLAVGSRIAFVAHFLGRKLEYTYEVVELIPLEKLVMKTNEGPFPMETTYMWTAIDDSTTKMVLRNKGNPTGFSRLWSPLMAVMIRKANKKDLLRIKNILEEERIL